jgi:hypothetical protein
MKSADDEKEIRIGQGIANKVYETLLASNANVNFFVFGDYNVAGENINTGSGIISQPGTFEQEWDRIKEEIDLHLAADHLLELRKTLRDKQDIPPDEREQTICAIVAAEKSAKEDDGVGVLRHLQKIKTLSPHAYAWIVSFTASIAANHIGTVKTLITAAFGIGT